MVSYPGTVNGNQKVTGSQQVGTTLTVGAVSGLGDNGVGEVQLANATTQPTTNPAGGVTAYVDTTSATPWKVRDPAGNVRSVVDGFFNQTTNPTFTLAAQTATPLTIAVEANARYEVTLCAIFDNATGVTTASWTGPAGATMQWVDTTSSLDYSATIGATNNTFVANAGTRMAIFKGNLLTTTAGALTFTLGVSAGTTTLRAGSYIRTTRVA